MTATARNAGNDQADLAAIVEGIATLKQDLAVLTDRLKRAGANGARARAHEATAELGGQVEQLYDSLAAHGENAAKAIGRKVEAQPITALLIAFGIGLIGGRILSD